MPFSCSASAPAFSGACVDKAISTGAGAAQPLGRTAVARPLPLGPVSRKREAPLQSALGVQARTAFGGKTCASPPTGCVLKLAAQLLVGHNRRRVALPVKAHEPTARVSREPQTGATKSPSARTSVACARQPEAHQLQPAAAESPARQRPPATRPYREAAGPERAAERVVRVTGATEQLTSKARCGLTVRDRRLAKETTRAAPASPERREEGAALN